MLKAPVDPYRWLAAGLFIVVVIVPIGALAIAAGGAYLSTLHELALLREEAASYQKDIGGESALLTTAQSITKEIVASQGLYKDTTSEAASAKLSQTIKDLLHQADGELRSVSMSPTQKTGSLDKLEVAMDATISSKGLPTLLTSLQTQRPFLIIESIDISAGQFSAVPGQLWVKMKVAAFRRVRNATT